MIKKLHKKILLSACFVASMVTSNAQTGLHFDGVDDYVQGTTTPVTGNGARTIEAWVRTTKNSLPINNGGDGQSVICDWGYTTSGQRSTLNLLWNNSVRFETAAGGVSGVTPVNDGEWHHVAAVYDPSASGDKVKVYVDGVMDASGNPTVNTSSITKFRIGKRVDGSGMFQGDMDEVRVWDYAMTEAELQSRMNVELCGDETGLVAYYPFGEGIPGADNTAVTSTSDMSPSNDVAALNNFALTGETSNWGTGHGLVALSGSTLTAAQTGATYQWVNCDNANAAIEGATAQAYTPESSGNYAVEITVGGCTSTSECMEVSSLGVEDILFANSLKLYPNPTSGELNVTLNGVYQTVDAQLVSITGKVVATYQFGKANEFAIDLNNFNSGLYFLNIKADHLDAATVKVVKM